MVHFFYGILLILNHNYCNNHYRYNDDLKKHLWESYNIGIEEIYSCVYCSKKFKIKNLLNKHTFICKHMFMYNNDN